MPDKVIFVLSGDVKALETIGHTLAGAPLEITCFIQPAKFMERLRNEDCDLAITDLTMRGIDSTGLATQIALLKPWVPVIALVDKGDVTRAVTAVRAGVADAIEKPLDAERLRRTVESLVRENFHTRTYVGKPLTNAEMRVLKLILADKTNSEMALVLRCSLRTVEWHRANVMKKLGAQSLVGLVKRAIALGIADSGTRADGRKRLHESGQPGTTDTD